MVTRAPTVCVARFQQFSVVAGAKPSLVLVSVHSPWPWNWTLSQLVLGKHYLPERRCDTKVSVWIPTAESGRSVESMVFVHALGSCKVNVFGLRLFLWTAGLDLITQRKCEFVFVH